MSLNETLETIRNQLFPDYFSLPAEIQDLNIENPRSIQTAISAMQGDVELALFGTSVLSEDKFPRIAYWMTQWQQRLGWSNRRLEFVADHLASGLGQSIDLKQIESVRIENKKDWSIDITLDPQGSFNGLHFKLGRSNEVAYIEVANELPDLGSSSHLEKFYVLPREPRNQEEVQRIFYPHGRASDITMLFDDDGMQVFTGLGSDNRQLSFTELGVGVLGWRNRPLYARTKRHPNDDSDGGGTRAVNTWRFARNPS